MNVAHDNAMRIIRDYPVYRDEWRKYVEAITAPGIAPEAPFCGPSATPGKTAWARDFVGDFGKSGRLAFLSQHDYPGGAGNRATNVVAARDKMLSAAWVIQDDASWTGTWTSLTTRSTSGQFTLKLPSATAAVVKLAR
jgi:hypothetical protein